MLVREERGGEGLVGWFAGGGGRRMGRVGGGGEGRGVEGLGERGEGGTYGLYRCRSSELEGCN